MLHKYEPNPNNLGWSTIIITWTEQNFFLSFKSPGLQITAASATCYHWPTWTQTFCLHLDGGWATALFFVKFCAFITFSLFWPLLWEINVTDSILCPILDSIQMRVRESSLLRIGRDKKSLLFFKRPLMENANHANCKGKLISLDQNGQVYVSGVDLAHLAWVN